MKAKKLNKYQRIFASKVHGSLNSKHDKKQKLSDYGETMKMLQPTISRTKIWLPTQDHIIQYVKDGIIVARASWLYGFDNYSYFDADNRGVSTTLLCVGYRLKPPKAARKN